MRAIVLGSTLLLAGCSHTLKVTVSRYDVDAAPGGREKYEQARRKGKLAAEAKADLARAQLALARYRGCVTSLNALVQVAFPGLPDRDKAVAGKRSAIEATFAPLEKTLASAAAAVAKLSPDDLAPAVPAAEVSWARLQEALAKANVETDPERLRTVLGQLANLPSDVLVAQAKDLTPRLDALLADPATSCVAADARQALNAAIAPQESARADRARAFTTSFGQALEGATRTAVADLAAARGGDLVPRPYGVWQDMTDPFLMFISANDAYWRPLIESTKVGGSGDVEYVLVFESPLDARLKTVTVDPSKVVTARLTIARKVAQAAVAAAGIATASFGVPLPTIAVTAAANGAGGEKKDPADTIDFSRMTADEQIARERNAAVRRRLEELKRKAADVGKIESPEAAARALRMLQRELAGIDANTLSM
jgi:hypothetical protein